MSALPMPHNINADEVVLSTTLVAVFSAAVIVVSPVSPIFQAIFTVPATVTESIMTCKVFRDMILRSLSTDQNLPLTIMELDAGENHTLIELQLTDIER